MDSLPFQTAPSPPFPPEYLAESRSASILSANIILQFVSSLFVCGRVFSRVFLLRQFKADDYLIVVSWILATGFSTTTFLSVHYGLGKHAVTIPPQNQVKLGISGFCAQLLFIAVLPLIKLSMCISYRSVFHSDKISRMTLTVAIMLLITTGITFEFVSIFQCNPISHFWNDPFHRTCINIQPAFYSNGVSNLLTDVMLIVIVVLQVLKLQMHQRQKIALLAVVSLGWLAVIAGIIRMVRVSRLVGPLVDPAWDAYDITIWTGLEVHISLFCAAAPCIRPLVLKLMPHLLGSTLKSATAAHSYKNSAHRLSGIHKSVRHSWVSTLGDAQYSVSATTTTSIHSHEPILPPPHKDARAS